MSNKSQNPNAKIQVTSGFTLVEMLISITIFMIFIGIAGGSYTSLVSANRSANKDQKTYHEVRNVFDTLAAEIHGGVLDYSCLDPTDDIICSINQNSTQKKILSVLDPQQKKRMLVRFDKISKQILVMRQELISVDGPAFWKSDENGWQQLISKDFAIEDFSFDVFPFSDPYSLQNTNNDFMQYQPAITLLLKTKWYLFRTTYSSRTYGKKSLYNAT